MVEVEVAVEGRGCYGVSVMFLEVPIVRACAVMRTSGRRAVNDLVVLTQWISFKDIEVFVSQRAVHMLSLQW